MLCLDDRAAGLEGAKDVGPPKFVTQLQSRIEISEGQSAHFEARLTPTEDPNMKVCQGSAVLKSLFDFVPGMAFLGGGRPAHMSCYHSLAHPSGSLVKGT